MRILAWYYTFADIGLIAQVHYYRRTSAKASFEAVIASSNTHATKSSRDDQVTETTSLLLPYTTTTTTNDSDTLNSREESILEEASKAANNTASSSSSSSSLGSVSIATPSSGTGSDTISGQQQQQSKRGYGATSAGNQSNNPHQSVSRRGSEALSTMTTQSARERFKAALEKRRWIRTFILIVVPLMATCFFVWTYFDWLQCLSRGGQWEEGEDGNGHSGAHCGRGHGRGRLPPLPGHEGHGAEEDGEILLRMLDNNHNNETAGGAYDSWMPLIFGWGSAALYLGSRVPQIYKNWRLQSCEGLSMFMFLFSVMGNALYVTSIFLNSLERTYLIRNMPYWLGSSGTLMFDFTIFCQFYLYRHNQPLTEALKDATESGALNQDTVKAITATTGSPVSSSDRSQDIEQGR
ncbi:hypothetical protein BGZ94_007481 [Podila epigama]|nr:hypothetical protein BGZ94_007481 [Podila epigama]